MKPLLIPTRNQRTYHRRNAVFREAGGLAFRIPPEHVSLPHGSWNPGSPSLCTPSPDSLQPHPPTHPHTHSSHTLTSTSFSLCFYWRPTALSHLLNSLLGTIQTGLPCLPLSSRRLRVKQIPEGAVVWETSRYESLVPMLSQRAFRPGSHRSSHA